MAKTETYYPTSHYLWSTIVKRPVVGAYKKKMDNGRSMAGRGVCLVHEVTTPLFITAIFGQFAREGIRLLSVMVGVMTLNVPINGDYALKVQAHVIDMSGILALFAPALVSRIAKAALGAIIHPAIFIDKPPKNPEVNGNWVSPPLAPRPWVDGSLLYKRVFLARPERIRRLA